MLGPLEVLREGQPVSLGGARQRAVLARLLVEPSVAVSVDRIIDAVWGEHATNGYVTTVQTYVFHLREALEPDRAKGAPGTVLVTSGNGYRFDPPEGSVDSIRFELAVGLGRRALEAGAVSEAARILSDALSLWRGEVLSDLGDLEFVTLAAARLSELRLSATEAWIEAELALGHHEGLVSELGRLTSGHPLRERFQAQRMLALYRSGRQAEALAAYREVRTLLDEELGVEPGLALRTLHERILRQDPGLAPAPTDSVGVSGPDGPASPGQDLVLPPSAPMTDSRDAPAPHLGRAEIVRTLRLSRRARLATIAVIVLVVGLIGAGIYRVASSGSVTALPPNSVGALTLGGLSGEAIQMGASPVALTEAGGSVWVVNQTQQSVVRIDPQNRRIVQTIQDVGGSPEAIASSGTDVWVAAGNDGLLARINVADNKLVAKIPVGILPAAVVATANDVWVANSGDNTVQHVDPATGRADPAVPVGDGPDGLALDGTTLWVANGRSGSLTQVDTRTGQRAAADTYVDSGPSGIAVTATDVWVANQLSQSVSRVSRATGKVARIGVDDGPSSVVVADGAVWVAETYAGSVSRIDPETGSVTRLMVGSSPRALARVGDEVWAASGAFSDQGHIGGTMTMATGPGALVDGETVDPAGLGSPFVLELLRPVYDGLVAFRAVGSAAQTLVPDLATALPRPSDGGRTYVFTVRQGIRYSDGRVVSASDFVLGTRRALLAKGGAGEVFAGIVGARACIESPEFPNLCDLSRGVVADDSSGSVTFHLVAADPEFLYKLTALVVATPPGTPLADQSLTPLPGTGPYMVAKVAPSGDLTLVRNPYFAQWSFAAQPSGYPDVIVRRTRSSITEAGADVLAGSADIANVLGPDVAITHPAQTHHFDKRNTDFVYLNNHVPPFDDLRVRQALNYAVDHRELLSLYGQGDGFATLTCQMIPPGFPSYRRYCPYQTGPADGPYRGPDLAKARELVRTSGTSGTSIVIHALPGPSIYAAFPRYLAAVLTDLGYVTRIEDIPPGAIDATVQGRPYSTYQLFTQSGWLADYPVASSMYSAISRCEVPANVYCNKTIDAAARKASALEDADPNASLAAWTSVDRMLTDDAAFVALGNHGGTQVVSERVGNYQALPGTGAILSQLWVR